MKRKPHNKPSDPLPSDVKALQEMVAELQSQVSYLKRMLFGRRSEKLGNDPNQGTLFGPSEADVTVDADQEEVPEDDEETVPPRRRTRHRGRRPLPEHLPRCLHEIHPPSEELTCPCCGESKTVFSQDVTEELEVVPAKFFVNKYVRFKYSCRRCEGYVSTGTLPPRPLDKGIPGPGFLAHLLTSKFADHRVQGEAVSEMRVGPSWPGDRTRPQTSPELRRSRAVVGSVGCKRCDLIASGGVCEVERK